MAEDLKGRLEKLRKHFNTGATRTYAFRLDQLRKLKQAVLHHEQELYEALNLDLKKSPEESWVTEVGFLVSEINHCLKNLREWMRPVDVSTNLLNFPSRSFVLHEPLGVVLLIAPWNYPLQLLFTPLLGAIAAGNCVVMKPSEFAPATSKVMERIITTTFPSEYILFVQGDGAEVVPALMKNFRFNHIFYTGSTAIGKKIYQEAAAQLVPVTLELGGKSPCIVESDANLKVAARRIAVTKFSNAGQMCVAPDYVLVQRSVKNELIELLKESIKKFYSNDPSQSYNYGRIINERQFDRLVSYVKHGEVIYGGKHDKSKLYIEPTMLEVQGSAHGVLRTNDLGNPLLTEEIFGPLLPIISYDTFEEAKSIIEKNPDPLAFYVFTSSKRKEKDWLESVSFGGGCVNNASWHLTNPDLPFGGRGNSGIGNYHGKNSFEIFSHRKAVMKTPTWFDPAIKYPPFKGKLGLFKRIIR